MIVEAMLGDTAQKSVEFTHERIDTRSASYPTINRGSTGCYPYEERMTADTRLLHGSLTEFGLVEILQMMELGGMTGAIHLKQPGGRIGIIYFDEGKLANCSELDVGALTLGDVLQQLGMATNEQIEWAFAQQLHDVFGMRIGERLMMMRVISAQQLKEALRTKALWIARELSLWRVGTYEFISSSKDRKILPYGEEPLGLEVMRVTMEMVRYVDEWEQLRPFLPQGMHTALQMAPAIPYAMSFDTRTLEILGQVNRNRSVRRVADALLRPELEVARDLAQLVQQLFLLQFVQETPPRRNGHAVRLPDPAEKLRMESFEFLNLISRMEQDWNRRRSPMDQLPALVEYVNWTMDALAQTCKANGIELEPHTLEALLVREKLRYVGNYKFILGQNEIDVENFTSLCHEILGGEMRKSVDFYDEASIVLQRMLRAVFDMINSRVASLVERLENQEVWEAMFTQFALQRQ
jgi:hypothetical protein